MQISNASIAQMTCFQFTFHKAPWKVPIMQVLRRADTGWRPLPRAHPVGLSEMRMDFLRVLSEGLHVLVGDVLIIISLRTFKVFFVFLFFAVVNILAGIHLI